MTTYKNGQLPASALKAIAGTHLLIGTANAFQRAINACLKEGIVLDTWGGNAGYRDLADQAGMRKAFLTHDVALMHHYAMDTSSRATPAFPGYSPHGLGLAVDIRVTHGSVVRARAILAHYGFAWPFRNNDVNHYVHDGHTATSSLTSTPVPAKTAPVKPTRRIYTVKAGDTVAKIARKARISLHTFEHLNPQIKNINNIKVGQRLYLS